MDPAQDLHAQLRSVSAALAAARREVRAAKAQEKRRATRSEGAWRLPPRLRHAALIIYVNTGYCAEPAVKYLDNCGKMRHWPPKCDAELAAMVEDVFLQADEVEIAALADPADPTDVAAFRAAVPYVEQWMMVSWALDQNVHKGLAPSTSTVLDRLEARRRRLPPATRPGPSGSATEVRGRVWGLRWRRRWGGRHAKIRTREDQSLDDMRAKVWVAEKSTRGTALRSQNWSRIAVPDLGPPP